MNKICSCCKIEKNISEFNKRSVDKSGYNGKCRECVKKYMKIYHIPRRKRRIQDTWKEGHKVCSSCKKELSFDNFHKAKLGYAGLKTNCKSCEQIRNNEYRRKNGWESEYRKRRRRTDTQFKIKSNLRCRLSDALKRHTSGGIVNKKHSALKLLGCSINEFIEYVSNKFTGNMNWNNYGNVWEIDHIHPCSSFDLTNIDHQKQCFHYTNLQPLTVSQNRSKGAKIEYDVVGR